MRFWFLFFTFLFLAFTDVYCEEAYIYDSQGKRDPFVPLVGVTTRTSVPLEEIMSIDEVQFQGAASDSKGKKIVILNGEMVSEGATIGHICIKRVVRDEVVLTIDGEEHTLTMY